ncbi:MAG: N-acetylmuramoyl-L-alanine amidase [Lachnospiraceae bacterium]
MKLVLDAGHGGFDNGAMFENRKEKDDALRLTLAVGERLKEDGYDVYYTRTSDVYQSPFEKAQLANEQKGDYFISFHRNDSLEPNQYHGVQSLIFSDESKAKNLAENINDQLEKVGFTDIGVEERPGLVVLRHTKMPAVLLEAGFLNSDVDNQIFDEKFQAVVDAIVRGIEETLPLARTSKEPAQAIEAEERKNESPVGEEPKEAEEKIEQTVIAREMEKFPKYAVQTGLFRYLNNALYLMAQLRRDGFSPELDRVPKYYRVFVRSEGGIEEARKLQNALRRKQYDTLIIEKKD